MAKKIKKINLHVYTFFLSFKIETGENLQSALKINSPNLKNKTNGFIRN
jgi:hypothetical protein